MATLHFGMPASIIRFNSLTLVSVPLYDEIEAPPGYEKIT
jgi:hypothetical protein